MTRCARTFRFVITPIGMAEQARLARERGSRRLLRRMTLAAGAGQMDGGVMRAAPRLHMTIRAVRPVGVVGRMTGSALTLPGEGHFGDVAVLADESSPGRDVDIVPERDVALAGLADHVQRKPNRPCRGNGVSPVACGACQRTGRVVMACGAVGRLPHARRPVRRAGSVASAAGQAVMPGVLERAADKRLRRHAALVFDEPGSGSVWRRPSGAHREYGERRCDNKLCDAVLGAPPGATAHGVGLVTLFHLHVRRRLQHRPSGNA